MELGVPHGIKTETGNFLDMDATINAALKDDMHVWVVLGGTCTDSSLHSSTDSWAI